MWRGSSGPSRPEPRAALGSGTVRSARCSHTVDVENRINTMPLHYACLQSPRDGGALAGCRPWSQSQTRLRECAHMHAHTRSMCVRISVFMDVCVLTLLLILGQNLVVVHGAAECAPGAAACSERAPQSGGSQMEQVWVSSARQVVASLRSEFPGEPSSVG